MAVRGHGGQQFCGSPQGRFFLWHCRKTTSVSWQPQSEWQKEKHLFMPVPCQNSSLPLTGRQRHLNTLCNMASPLRLCRGCCKGSYQIIPVDARVLNGIQMCGGGAVILYKIKKNLITKYNRQAHLELLFGLPGFSSIFMYVGMVWWNWHTFLT